MDNPFEEKPKKVRTENPFDKMLREGAKPKPIEGRKSNGQWQPGTVNNPNGRAPESKEMKYFKKLRKEEHMALFEKYAGMDFEKAKTAYEAPGLCLVDGIFLKIMIDAYTGDASARNTFLDRVYGKVVDRQEVITKENFDDISHISDEDKLTIASILDKAV